MSFSYVTRMGGACARPHYAFHQMIRDQRAKEALETHTWVATFAQAPRVDADLPSQRTPSMRMATAPYLGMSRR